MKLKSIILFCALFMTFQNVGAAISSVESTDQSTDEIVTESGVANVADDDTYNEDDLAALAEFDQQMQSLYPELSLQDVASKGGKARLVIVVDKSSQTMNVTLDGKHKFGPWKVSTGKAGWDTRNGNFTPFEMNKNYVSKMFSKKLGKKVILPYGIKFDGGNLIHAASKAGTQFLGTRRSHGCVRLHPSNASQLYSVVQQVGMKNTRVIVQK